MGDVSGHRTREETRHAAKELLHCGSCAFTARNRGTLHYHLQFMGHYAIRGSDNDLPGQTGSCNGSSTSASFSSGTESIDETEGWLEMESIELDDGCAGSEEPHSAEAGVTEVKEEIRASRSNTTEPSAAITSMAPVIRFLYLKDGRMRPEKMCPVCEQVFASEQSMRRHAQRRHPDRVAECEERGYKEDTRLLPFVCETCTKSFATLAYLQSHTRRMHTVRKRFACEICQRTYPLMAELRKHVKRVHISNGTASAGSENESAQSTRGVQMPALRLC